MPNVTSHYENLLADHYSWLFGGLEIKAVENREFLKKNGLTPCGSGIAVDLGAGSGFQSIPLAQLGFSVTAIDLSGKLLAELTSNSKGLKIKTVKGDLLKFSSVCSVNVELFVCMGDTLTHLDSTKNIRKLLKDIYRFLEKKGKVVLTFRDLTHELKGVDRFIPVKNDENRIFTCFLEYEPETVKIHDLVYARSNSGWSFKSSSYRKLRIGADWVESQLIDTGFGIDVSNVDKGWVTDDCK